MLFRSLATRFGLHAVDLAAQKKIGRVVVLKNNCVTDVSFSEIKPYTRRKILLNDHFIRCAESLGVSLGRS